MNRIVMSVMVLCGLLLAPARSDALPSDLRVDRITGFEFATGMAHTPSGDRLFVNEREGRVRMIVGTRLHPKPVARIKTTTQGEGGLLGLAVHPEFERGKPFLYVFATASDARTNRVVRLRIQDNVATEQRTILGGLGAGTYHHGGILAFGPDGKLYVSHGESHETDRAQKPRTLGGKIYRLGDDGSIPSDNPFPGSPTFAYGIRNPFGLAFDPMSGLLWETENGPNNHDEINIIERGRNYGWPIVRGDANDSRFVDPVRDYTAIIVPTMATFGAAPLPPAYRGAFFFGTFGTEEIRMLEPSKDRRSVAREQPLHKAGAGVVGITMGPDGLWYSTSDALFRIRAKTSSPASPLPSPDGSSASASASPNAIPDEGSGGRGAGALLIALIASGIAGSLLLVRYRRR